MPSATVQYLCHNCMTLFKESGYTATQTATVVKNNPKCDKCGKRHYSALNYLVSKNDVNGREAQEMRAYHGV